MTAWFFCYRFHTPNLLWPPGTPNTTCEKGRAGLGFWAAACGAGRGPQFAPSPFHPTLSQSRQVGAGTGRKHLHGKSCSEESQRQMQPGLPQSGKRTSPQARSAPRSSSPTVLMPPLLGPLCPPRPAPRVSPLLHTLPSPLQTLTASWQALPFRGERFLPTPLPTAPLPWAAHLYPVRPPWPWSAHGTLFARHILWVWSNAEQQVSLLEVIHGHYTALKPLCASPCHARPCLLPWCCAVRSLRPRTLHTRPRLTVQPGSI